MLLLIVQLVILCNLIFVLMIMDVEKIKSLKNQLLLELMEYVNVQKLWKKSQECAMLLLMNVQPDSTWLIICVLIKMDVEKIKSLLLLLLKELMLLLDFVNVLTI